MESQRRIHDVGAHGSRIKANIIQWLNYLRHLHAQLAIHPYPAPYTI